MALKGGNHISNYKFSRKTEDDYRRGERGYCWSYSRKQLLGHYAIVECMVDVSDMADDEYDMKFQNKLMAGKIIKVMRNRLILCADGKNHLIDQYSYIKLFDTEAEFVKHKLIQ